MIVTPIRDIDDLKDGDVIECVRGKVRKVFKQFDGENTKGPWTVQDLVIADRTGDIKVKIWNQDEIPKKWIGKRVVIEAKDGKYGVFASDDDFHDKITRVIRMTDTGIIDLDDSDENDEPEERSSSRRESRRETPKREEKRRGGGRRDYDEGPEPKERRSGREAPPADMKRGSEIADWRDVVVHLSGPLKDKKLSELEPNQFAWLEKSWLPRADMKNEADIALVGAVNAAKKGGGPTGQGSKTNGNGGGHAEVGTPEAIREVKLGLIQRANLYNMVVGAVHNVIEPQWEKITGEKMLPTDFQSAIARLSIDAGMAGLHNRLPRTLMVPEEKTKPTDATGKPLTSASATDGEGKLL